MEAIFVDSNCLSYVIDAMHGVEEPTDELAPQRIALVRVYLYAASTLWTVPTVEREFERIRDEERRARHRAWCRVLFGVRPIERPGAATARALELLPAHADEDDRQLVAEVEAAGGEVLLSFDIALVKHLAPLTTIRLTTPLEYWEELAIPRGATPRTVPRYDNPLARQAWWRW